MLNDPRPTLQTIARAAGCSRMTVSLALRNRAEIPAETRARIQQTAKDLGYVPDATLNALMDQVRAQKPRGFQALIAVLHLMPRRAAETTPGYAAWMAGAKERGMELGYQLDDFWLVDETLDVKALTRTLAARNVRGLLMPFWPNSSVMPENLHPLLESYPSATVGHQPPDCPPMPGAKNDSFATGAALFAKAVEAGNRRIGLVLLAGCEPGGDERFAAAIANAAKAAEGIPVLPVLQLTRRHEAAAFREWLEAHDPDCIISTSPRVCAWLIEAGLSVPEGIGFLYWQVDDNELDWSGMSQNESATGAAALDHVIAQMHGGISKHRAADTAMTLLPSTWVEGSTLQSK